MSRAFWRPRATAGIPAPEDWPRLYGGLPERGRSIADIADRYWLYQHSVQDVSVEVAFLHEVFARRHGRPPETLREDFCGTAALCAEWVSSSDRARATGVDLDPEPLAWARANMLPELGAAADRIELRQADAAHVRAKRVDIIAALNFSYWLFPTRAQLKAYFTHARAGLNPGGLLVLDAFGGSDAHGTLSEPRDCGAFTYIWEQAEFNPVTHHMTCHLHFEFPDGSAMKPAFSYQWRVWSLPELTELLLAAGFEKPRYYWHEPNDQGQAEVDLNPRDNHSPDPGWICYLLSSPA